MKKNYIWILLVLIIIILGILVFNMYKDNHIKEYKVVDNKNLDLDSISYSINSNTGRVYRKSIFISDKQYILTVEKTNDENNLEVEQYVVSKDQWSELDKIINKYDISSLSVKNIVSNDNDEVKSIDISYTNKSKKVQYIISSNMELLEDDVKIFDEVNEYLEKIENNSK